MKKFFDIVMPVKTAACYIFTATMCVYAVLDLVFGWGGLPDNYLFSFLLLSLAGGVLQIVAFTELVIKRLRYTLRAASPTRRQWPKAPPDTALQIRTAAADSAAI